MEENETAQEIYDIANELNTTIYTRDHDRVSHVPVKPLSPLHTLEDVVKSRFYRASEGNQGNQRNQNPGILPLPCPWKSWYHPPIIPQPYGPRAAHSPLCHRLSY
jgi:hypothetical protein